MTADREVFDRHLLRRRRLRAAPAFAAHDFLHRRAADDIAARLQIIERTFPLAVILGSYQSVMGAALRRTARVGRIVSADPVPELAAACPPPRIVCDEETLPFAPASLDLVVSVLSLHLINDLPGALVQIARALKPDGLFLGAALGGRTLHELRAAFTAAEAELVGGVSPRVAPFADVRDYGALLQRAGFALPVADTDMLNVTYATPFDLMRDLRGMGASNALKERSRHPLRRTALMRATEIYAERFSEDGRVRATFEIVHLIGWAPHEGQQKPLAPGSARTRLADALGTQERPAGDKAVPAASRGGNPRGR